MSNQALTHCGIGQVVSVLTAGFLVFQVSSLAVAHDDQADGSVAELVATADHLNDRIELLRSYMGRPVDTQKSIEVRDATLREAYFQSLVTFRLAERLCVEQTRQHLSSPIVPSTEGSVADVESVLKATSVSIERVATKLGVPDDTPPQDGEVDATATDLFSALIRMNRQLNLLVDRPFAPNDVYEQVTVAIAYTELLLDDFPGSSPIPSPPPYETRKCPADVYRRLLECFHLVHDIAEESAIHTLTLHASEDFINAVQPNDVYQLASLLVAELQHLHTHQADIVTVPESYYVGRKIPSDVYQRAGILVSQLEELQRRSRLAPDWLKGGATANELNAR